MKNKTVKDTKNLDVQNSLIRHSTIRHLLNLTSKDTKENYLIFFNQNPSLYLKFLINSESKTNFKDQI